MIFRLGKIKKGGAVGPGLFTIIPCIDDIIKVDLRTVTFDVPSQEILTKDSVTVFVNAIMYYKVRSRENCETSRSSCLETQLNMYRSRK